MKKIIFAILAVFISLVLIAAPVSAATKCTVTSILGDSTCKEDGTFLHEGAPSSGGEYSCSCDDGEGGAIMDILKLVVNIMTIGIGILAAVGIAITGTQYLTAGGNEEKTKKAKRRLFEIVIGLIAYLLIYSILYFLLPGFSGI